jgi:3-oxoacyl-[acyl-carrier protein] reductase
LVSNRCPRPKLRIRCAAPDALRQVNADPRARPYATPEEIADIALFLAGDQASNLVGAVLLANGGRFRR